MPASTATLNPRKAVGSKAFLVPAKGGPRRPPIRRSSTITLRTLDGKLIEQLDTLEAAKVTYAGDPKEASVKQINAKTRKKIQDAPALAKGTGLKQERFGYI